LKDRNVPQDFGFIADQKGMFSYSGLTRDQVHKLRAEYSLYIVDSGRICVAAMNEKKPAGHLRRHRKRAEVGKPDSDGSPQFGAGAVASIVLQR